MLKRTDILTFQTKGSGAHCLSLTKQQYSTEAPSTDWISDVFTDDFNPFQVQDQMDYLDFSDNLPSFWDDSRQSLAFDEMPISDAIAKKHTHNEDTGV